MSHRWDATKPKTHVCKVYYAYFSLTGVTIMPNRAVEFYENKMGTNFKETMTRNASLFSRLSIPPEEVCSATSLSDLSERYAIPVTISNNFCIGAISALMIEYNFNGTGVPSRSVFGIMFGASNQSQDQKNIAHQVLRACDQAQFSVVTNRPIQDCINEIKSHLEAGLLASNLHPQDNFPKLVKAIANQTAGLDGWEFSSRAVAQLNNIENATNRPGV